MGDEPIFTKQKAWEVYGKLVMVGVTYVDGAGKVIEQKEYHGQVVRVNPTEGIVLRSGDGSEHRLPPDFRSFKKASPGEYRELSTGAVVVDPDYLCSWISTRNQESGKDD